MRKSVWSHYRRATRCGLRDAEGNRYLSVPVRASWSWLSGGECRELHAEARVIARSPAEAANYWLEVCAVAAGRPVEVEAVGVSGGVTHRYAGWDKAGWLSMLDERPAAAVQMRML